MIKPGYTTTEFYMALATNLIAAVALIHPGFKVNDALVQELSAGFAAVANMVYMFSRTTVKTAALAVAEDTSTPLVTTPAR